MRALTSNREQEFLKPFSVLVVSVFYNSTLTQKLVLSMTSSCDSKHILVNDQFHEGLSLMILKVYRGFSSTWTKLYSARGNYLQHR